MIICKKCGNETVIKKVIITASTVRGGTLFDITQKDNRISFTLDSLDEYEVVAFAKRLGYTFEELKEMSYVTLMNNMLSNVEEEDKTATQEDIDRFFGG